MKPLHWAAKAHEEMFHLYHHHAISKGEWKELQDLYVDLIREEVQELLEKGKVEEEEIDLVEVADALGDLHVVCLGFLQAAQRPYDEHLFHYSMSTVTGLAVNKESHELAHRRIIDRIKISAQKLKRAHFEARVDIVEMMIPEISYLFDHFEVNALEVFNEIHRSNMSKLNDGNPVYNEAGKVMKPDGYRRPDIRSIVECFDGFPKPYAMAQLISVTSSLAGPNTVQNFSPEELLVYMARVSNHGALDKMSDPVETERLIKYLITHKHWSPFDMVDVTFKIETYRYVSHQLIRHWSMRFQEFSQRYSSNIEILPQQFRMKAKSNRQGSGSQIPNALISFNGKLMPLERAGRLFNHIAKDFYDQMIKIGVAPETARAVLPEATSSHLYMKGSLRSWLHFLDIRNDSLSQLEMQVLAQQVHRILKIHFPTVIKSYFN
jgi:thymidylate synthase (FAD)